MGPVGLVVLLVVRYSLVGLAVLLVVLRLAVLPVVRCGLVGLAVLQVVLRLGCVEAGVAAAVPTAVRVVWLALVVRSRVAGCRSC